MNKNRLHLLLAQKAKQDFIKEGLHHYLNKLYPFASIEVLEPKNEKNFKESCKQLEKKTITIVLDPVGRQFTSESFSKMWEALTNQKSKGISFIIGGPYGFSKLPRADISFSLSSLTYNHELVPLILLEQVYRAYTILKRLPYHHV